MSREITITNGAETRIATIEERDGQFFLHDSADLNWDSLVPLADDSDTSVADAIRDNGWEIAE